MKGGIGIIMQMELMSLPSIPDVKSPLGYPGGKRRLWIHLEPYLPSDLKELVSPFIGGGAIELACTGKLIQVEAADNFEPLTNFWQNFIKSSSDVVDLVLDLYPLSFNERMHYHNTQLKKNSIDIEGNLLSDFERSAIYFCINKQSFRAWGLARPPSKCELLKSVDSFKKWKTWQNEYIQVKCSDYVPMIENANGRFLYLDPPYVNKEYFYGAYKDDSTFDHENLASLLHKTNSKWIMSYGKHPLIEKLYKDYTILEPQWKYTTRPNSDPTSAELLILNL